jgi:branched-chain amino acid transport system permease protein
LSSAYAGIAGALLTQTTAFVSLSVLHFERSADVLLMLILGGTGYLYGGLIGAVIFKLLHSWIASLTPEYWQFWIGAFLVAIVLLRRTRIRSAFASMVERFRNSGIAQSRVRS